MVLILSVIFGFVMPAQVGCGFNVVQWCILKLFKEEVITINPILNLVEFNWVIN